MIQLILTAEERYTPDGQTATITLAEVTVWAVKPDAMTEPEREITYDKHGDKRCSPYWSTDGPAYTYYRGKDLSVILEDQINQFIQQYPMGGASAICVLGVLGFTK